MADGLSEVTSPASAPLDAIVPRSSHQAEELHAEVGAGKHTTLKSATEQDAIAEEAAAAKSKETAEILKREHQSHPDDPVKALAAFTETELPPEEVSSGAQGDTSQPDNLRPPTNPGDDGTGEPLDRSGGQEPPSQGDTASATTSSAQRESGQLAEQGAQHPAEATPSTGGSNESFHDDGNGPAPQEKVSSGETRVGTPPVQPSEDPTGRGGVNEGLLPAESIPHSIEPTFEQKAMADFQQTKKGSARVQVLQAEQAKTQSEIDKATKEGKDTLAQVLKDKSERLWYTASLEAQQAYANKRENNVDQTTKDRIATELALVKAEDDVLKANNNKRQQQIEKTAREIDAMDKRGNIITTQFEQKKLIRLQESSRVEALSKLTTKELEELAKAAVQNGLSEAWVKTIQKFNPQNAEDLQKKLAATVAYNKVYEKVMGNRDRSGKTREQRLRDMGRDIDMHLHYDDADAQPSQEVIDFYLNGNPHNRKEEEIEGLIRESPNNNTLVQEYALLRRATEQEARRKTAGEQDKGDEYKRAQKEEEETKRKLKKVKGRGRINKLSLENARRQFRADIKNALFGPKSGRAEARKDAFYLALYITRRTARNIGLFYVLSTIAFWTLGPLWVAKKLGDWFGGR